jgi:pimeloyl-ACP methyl ester carboxylesterase
MPQIKANGINLEYASHGDPKNETVLLIMGLGAQMTRWPEPLIQKLVDKGFRVVAYDNRDVGLSEKIESAGAPNMGAIMEALSQGKKPPVAYTVDDMAADAAGLLDALNIKAAHVVGASMGGMIGQTVAADYPQKTLSFVSIMSATGSRDLPPPKPEAIAVLNNRGPDPKEDWEGFLAHSVQSSRTIGSPGFPMDEKALRERTERDFKRSHYPVGFQRQYAGVMASPSRLERLAKIKAPTIVLHGADDPLVPLAGGEDTAKRIPGAELVVVPGMGHDLPPGVFDTVVDTVVRAASRAKANA